MRPARTILLATDLTVRSDRASARAALLAEQCDAELVAVHVVSAASRSEERAREEMAYDLARAERVQIEIARVPDRAGSIDEADIASAIVRAAREHAAGVIVTGVVRSERFLGPSLGKTVDRLISSSKVPLLFVSERARAAYKNVVIAIDFSAASHAAVVTAAALFPRAHLTLLHAFTAPSATATIDPKVLDDEHAAIAETKYQAFVRDIEFTSPPTMMLRRGEPAAIVGQIAQTRGIDLVVLGTHGRGFVAEVLIGSVAKRILANVACDALLVPRAE